MANPNIVNVTDIRGKTAVLAVTTSAQAIVTNSGNSVSETFVVTVVNDGTANIFVIDGVNKPVLALVRGGVYTFDQSDASNTNHLIAFKDSAGASYTVGVVTTGTPGTAGAQTVITVANNAPDDLRYYCVSHGNYMGNTINVINGGKIFKINSLIVANIDGTNNAEVTVDLFRSSIAYRIANTVVVPADATLVVLSKDASIYLEEGDSLRLTANANSDLEAICSYEEIS